jgi:hypothetical protein
VEMMRNLSLKVKIYEIDEVDDEWGLIFYEREVGEKGKLLI